MGDGTENMFDDETGHEPEREKAPRVGRQRKEEAPEREQPPPARQSVAGKARAIAVSGQAGKALEMLRGEANRMRRLIPEGTLDQKRAYRQLERALRNEPKLAGAAAKNPSSFVAAAEEWMMSGLPLHRDYCALVPYGDETVFVRCYRGLETLGYRSGRVSHFKAEAICANDTFEYDDGISPHLRFQRCLTDRGPVIGAWALAVLADGNTVFRVIGIDRLERGRKASHSKAWDTDTTEMAMKTAILALSKFLPMCPDLQVGASVEEARMAGVPVKFEPIQEAQVIDAPNGNGADQ